jgi:hypothetical protein
MLYTAVFMFVAMASFVVVNDLQTAEVPLQQNTVAREVGDGFVNVITLSVKGGEGFSYNYSFPRTIFGRPYRMDMRGLGSAKSVILLEWEGDYGNFSYLYDVPNYRYRVEGGCMSGDILNSSACSNVLMLSNDGENLTITQLP